MCMSRATPTVDANGRGDGSQAGIIHCWAAGRVPAPMQACAGHALLDAHCAVRRWWSGAQFAPSPAPCWRPAPRAPVSEAMKMQHGVSSPDAYRAPVTCAGDFCSPRPIKMAAAGESGDANAADHRCRPRARPHPRRPAGLRSTARLSRSMRGLTREWWLMPPPAAAPRARTSPICATRSVHRVRRAGWSPRRAAACRSTMTCAPHAG